MTQNSGGAQASPPGIGRERAKHRYLGLKITGVRPPLHVAIIFTTLAGWGSTTPAAAVSQAELQGKVAFCNTCHGASGQGYKGFYIGPRLAGQTVQYLESQFRQMMVNKRDNPAAKQFMVPALKGLTPEMRTALAQHYSGLDPAPAADGPAKLIAVGKAIFDEGVPDANVPACSACHGSDGKGIDAIPRLAGQLYPYLVAQLKGWQNGLRSMDSTNSDEPSTMLPIAKDMTPEQISAVAAYVSTLK